MAKRPKPEGKKYSYMDTYGDLVTLLLCFFVLLFAMSTVETSKYNAFVEALSQQFGNRPLNPSAVTAPVSSPTSDYGQDEPETGETLDPVEEMPSDMQKMVEELNEYIEQNNMQGDVSVEMDESGVVYIRLSDNLLFSGDSAVLSTGAEDFLAYLGEGFNLISGDIFQVDIMGHTGSIPGSATNDWLLSSERAGRVASFLERQAGFSPYKMHTVGYGRFYPIADNGTPEGLARNRRVDMMVLSNDAAGFYQSLADMRRVYFPSDDTQFFEGAQTELPSNAVDNIEPFGAQQVDLSQLSAEQIRALYDSLNGG